MVAYPLQKKEKHTHFPLLMNVTNYW